MLCFDCLFILHTFFTQKKIFFEKLKEMLTLKHRPVLKALDLDPPFTEAYKLQGN